MSILQQVREASPCGKKRREFDFSPLLLPELLLVRYYVSFYQKAITACLLLDFILVFKYDFRDYSWSCKVIRVTPRLAGCVRRGKAVIFLIAVAEIAQAVEAGGLGNV